MQMQAYYLEALTPFRLGVRGVGIEDTAVHCPSDTLFSALCHAIRQLYGLPELDAFLDTYAARQPAVVFSSAFPYIPVWHADQPPSGRLCEVAGNLQVVRLWPRPMEAPPGLAAEAAYDKKVKKIAWVSENILRAWLEGKNLEQHRVDGNIVQGSQVWLSADERVQVEHWRDPETGGIALWSEHDVPRVTVDRATNASTVYQAGRVRFQPGGGLWFLAQWSPEWQEKGVQSLRVLGDAGLGGGRSVGHGQFRLHGPYRLQPLPPPTSGGRFMTLSLYYPTEDELKEINKVEQEKVSQDGGLSYRLRVCQGWMASPDNAQTPNGLEVRGSALRRKAVRMFAEGSLLRSPNGETCLGDLARVTPNVFEQAHTVYRCGWTLAVGYRGQKGGSDG